MLGDNVSMNYPQLRLDRDVLDHNIAVMATWCRARGVELAPHVKTTMSRPIVVRQLAAGARGVTVATVDQAEAVADWFAGPIDGGAVGEVEILIANEVIDPGNLNRLRDLRDTCARSKEPAVSTIRILVDSIDGVAAAASALPDPGEPLEVLLDVGTPGGRAGVRDVAGAVSVADAVLAAPGLRLAGVAGYEGVVANSRTSEVIAAVDAHCAATRDIFERLRPAFHAAGPSPRPIFSMGGSAFPDRVVEHLPPGARVLLRSGCYVTHDHGTYAGVSPIAGLRPALRVRAVVLSAPEPGLVVLGAGKRDLAYDAGLPIVLGSPDIQVDSPGAGMGAAGTVADWQVSKLFDHHALLRSAGPGTLPIGTRIDLGLSHPCSVFDRWTDFVVTDAGGAEIDRWRTDFARR